MTRYPNNEQRGDQHIDRQPDLEETTSAMSDESTRTDEDEAAEAAAYQHTYRDIIKAKAEFLAHLTLYGDDIAVKAAMHDLLMFSKRIRAIGPMSLGYVYDEQERAYQAAERERAEASLRLRKLAEEGR